MNPVSFWVAGVICVRAFVVPWHVRRRHPELTDKALGRLRGYIFILAGIVIARELFQTLISVLFR